MDIANDLDTIIRAAIVFGVILAFIAALVFGVVWIVRSVRKNHRNQQEIIALMREQANRERR